MQTNPNHEQISSKIFHWSKLLLIPVGQIFIDHPHHHIFHHHRFAQTALLIYKIKNWEANFSLHTGLPKLLSYGGLGWLGHQCPPKLIQAAKKRGSVHDEWRTRLARPSVHHHQVAKSGTNSVFRSPLFGCSSDSCFWGQLVLAKCFGCIFKPAPTRE